MGRGKKGKAKQAKKFFKQHHKGGQNVHPKRRVAPGKSFARRQ